MFVPWLDDAVSVLQQGAATPAFLRDCERPRPAIPGTSPTQQAFRSVVPLTTFRIAEEADL